MESKKKGIVNIISLKGISSFTQNVMVYAIIIFPVLISLAIYNGVLEDTVESVSFEAGWLQEPHLPQLDYTMFVTFKSKGAFIAGQKISVTVELIPQNKKIIEKLKGSELIVIFPGSTPYPVKRSRDQIVDGTCILEFRGGGSAKGEVDLIYFYPEMYAKSVSVPYNTHGKFTYNLLINEKPQQIRLFNRSNSFLFIAPLETRLQVKHNNITLIISFIALYIAMFAFIKEFRRPKDKQ